MDNLGRRMNRMAQAWGRWQVVRHDEVGSNGGHTRYERSISATRDDKTIAIVVYATRRRRFRPFLSHAGAGIELDRAEAGELRDFLAAWLDGSTETR